MSRHLLKVEEVYRADNENEATDIINEAKQDSRFILSKYSSVKKELKQKGEIVDEWIRVSLIKVFDNEKEPINNTDISYNVNNSFTIK